MKSAKTITTVLMIFSLLFLGWIPKGGKYLKKPEKTSKLPADFITLNYTKLKLSKDQYNTLGSRDQFIKPANDAERRENENRKKNAIVFQFAYLSDIYPYPSLKAYPMRVKDMRTIFGLPVDLTYENSKPLPDLSVCLGHVTGDMQIAFSEMELLKKESNPKDPENYQYFLFTPKLDDLSQHVFFEVSVFPSTSPDLIPKTRIVNPSPPYGG